MNEKKNVYTVDAKRWGDRETHSYIVGVYSTEKKALAMAKFTEQYRGGKYVCEVIEWPMNSHEESESRQPRVVKGL